MPRPILALACALAVLAAAGPAAAHQRPCVDSPERCCAEGLLWVPALGRCVVPTS